MKQKSETELLMALVIKLANMRLGNIDCEGYKYCTLSIQPIERGVQVFLIENNEEQMLNAKINKNEVYEEATLKKTLYTMLNDLMNDNVKIDVGA